MKRLLFCFLPLLLLFTAACSRPEESIPTTPLLPTEKTFTVTEFSIDLNRSFYQKESSSLLFCRSEDVTLTVQRFPFSDYEGSGLPADASAAQWASEFAAPAFGGMSVEEKDGLVFLTKTEEVQGERFTYRQFCYRGGEGFYSVTFTVKAKNFPQREALLTEFAQSVRFRPLAS